MHTGKEQYPVAEDCPYKMVPDGMWLQDPCLAGTLKPVEYCEATFGIF